MQKEVKLSCGHEVVVSKTVVRDFKSGRTVKMPCPVCKAGRTVFADLGRLRGR